jgi:hypothetical protein
LKSSKRKSEEEHLTKSESIRKMRRENRRGEFVRSNRGLNSKWLTNLTKH